MRKSLVLSLAGALLIAGVLTAGSAAPKEIARHVLRRTAVVLVAAQKAARKGQKYFGLARAVAHQRYARAMYAKGYYLESIHHSLYARSLAAKVIRLNGAALVKEAYLDKLEKAYADKSPSAGDLDAKLKGQNIGSDEAAAKTSIEMDVP